MPVSSSIDQRDHLPLPTLKQHIKALPKAQFTHDVVRQVAKPVSHVPDHRPFFTIIKCHSAVVELLAGHDGAELANMQEHDVLHALEGIVRERLA